MATYETSTATHSETVHQGPAGIQFNPDYIKSQNGILKIVEAVLSLITFICACVVGWSGDGWVRFVSLSVFLTLVINFIFYLLGLRNRIPGPQLLIEFILYCVVTLLYLIAAIVAAASGGLHSSIGACAFFAFATTAVLAVDCFFQFRRWRSGEDPHMVTTTHTTTTTTTTATNVESGQMTY